MRAPTLVLGNGFVGATQASILTVNGATHRPAVVERKNKAKPRAKPKKCK